MIRLRLKAIKFGVDFRKTELTNYDSFKRSRSFPGELINGETYLFVSKSQNQLVWVFAIRQIENITGKEVRMIDSRKWRIEGSSKWNPLMLANYAEDVGIHLIGLKKFEELYEEQRSRK